MIENYKYTIQVYVTYSYLHPEVLTYQSHNCITSRTHDLLTSLPLQEYPEPFFEMFAQFIPMFLHSCLINAIYSTSTILNVSANLGSGVYQNVWVLKVSTFNIFLQ